MARSQRGDIGAGSVHLGSEAFEYPVRDPVEDLVRRRHMFRVIEVRPHRPTHVRAWVRRHIAHGLFDLRGITRARLAIPAETT